MVDLIEKNRSDLERICKQYGVERLELFGSAASGEFNPEKSDLDFLVRISPCTPGDHYERYFGLKETLEKLFGLNVDLVESGAMRNPVFIRHVNENRQLVYAA